MGLTVVDAGIIIGVLDAEDPHQQAAALVGPDRRRPAGRRVVDEFLADLAAEVEPTKAVGS